MSPSAPEYPELHRAGAVKLRSAEVLRSAVDLFVQASTHERAEVRAFADLLGGLLPDAEPAERLHAAQLLAPRADTPPAIARLLAMDTDAIAAAVILNSPVLTSADLVAIMRRGPEHVRLVAERLDLAPDVALALAQSSEADAWMRRTNGPTEPPPALGDPALVVEQIVERAVLSKPIADADTMAEVALQRALAELAAELEDDGLAFEDDEADADRAPLLDASGAPNEIEAFLAADPAGRWRIIQDYTTAAMLAPTTSRRRRAVEPAVVGARLFAASVQGDRAHLGRELADAAAIDMEMATRILRDRDGEPLAVILASLGIDERTATSILLLHGGPHATLGHMQDLSAMAGRIGWRTADLIVERWRGDRSAARTEVQRVLDPADRRGSGRSEAAASGERPAAETFGRRRSNEG